jgi:hypothetical protein
MKLRLAREEKLMDARLRDRLLAEGQISKEDVKKYLDLTIFLVMKHKDCTLILPKDIYLFGLQNTQNLLNGLLLQLII